MPRGTGAKLIENPRPPVPRPTRSSKLSRTAELTDEFVRGGGTASVPTFSWLIAPVPRMVAPVLVRRTMSPSSWETPNKLAEPRASPSSMDMATPACRAGGAAQMTSPSLLRLAVLELSAPNAHLAATHPAGSGSVTMEPPCAGPARGASPVAARVRDSDPTNIVLVLLAATPGAGKPKGRCERSCGGLLTPHRRSDRQNFGHTNCGCTDGATVYGSRGPALSPRPPNPTHTRTPRTSLPPLMSTPHLGCPDRV